jgi:hypothetical protein
MSQTIKNIDKVDELIAHYLIKGYSSKELKDLYNYKERLQKKWDKEQRESKERISIKYY